MSTTDFNTGQFNWKLYGSNLQSNSGQNLTLESSGNSNLILRTNGVTRLTIDSSGAWSWQGGMSYNNVSNALTATTFIGDLSGNISGGSGGQLLYQSSANVTDKLANGTAGYYLVANGGTIAPSWFNNKLFYYDEQWAEASNDNGLLGFRIDGTGAGTASMASAEANHYGIVRIATPSSNTNTTWKMRSPLIWSNINYVEVVFRGWAVGTSTNTTLSVGLLDNVNALDTTAISVMYSTNIAPTGVWQLRVGGVSAYTFNAINFPQLVNTWLKVRFTNTNDTGSWSATFTRLDTNVSETTSGTGILTDIEFYLGGGVSCVSGATSKRVDFDSFELLLK